MRAVIRFAVASAGCLASAGWTGPAGAATIDLANYAGGNGANLPVVTVTGELLPEDVYQFEHVVGLVGENAAVELNSPGGSLTAGIAIGRIIREKQFATVVKDMCASACALAWLAGGKLRFAALGAQIGFHVAYVGGAVKFESGMGNALVGHYLGELGLGENVVRYVTSASPEDMQWLTLRDASLLGLEVQNLDRPETAAAAAIPVTAYAPAAPEPARTQPPAPDQTLGLDQANTNRAVANANRRFGEAGLSGLVASSAACWKVAVENGTLDKVQYCRVLDLFGMVLKDAAGKQRLPKSVRAYFGKDRLVADFARGLVAAGIRDATLAAKLDAIWIGQVQSSVGLLASR